MEKVHGTIHLKLVPYVDQGKLFYAVYRGRCIFEGPDKQNAMMEIVTEYDANAVAVWNAETTNMVIELLPDKTIQVKTFIPKYAKEVKIW